MDILAAAGLVNHFGRIPENDKIIARPILLRKGTTMLALYGLANVRDERLFRTFQSGNVNFVKPQTGDDNCFNLLAVHQNHVAHTSTSYLPETFYQTFWISLYGVMNTIVLQSRSRTRTPGFTFCNREVPLPRV